MLDVISDRNGGLSQTPTHVADNLPEIMQYLNLVRGCCSIFLLPALPPNVIVKTKQRRNVQPDITAVEDDSDGSRDHNDDGCSSRQKLLRPKSRRSVARKHRGSKELIELDGVDQTSDYDEDLGTINMDLFAETERRVMVQAKSRVRQEFWEDEYLPETFLHSAKRRKY